MGGLDLRTRESPLRGGRRGAALVPGQAAKSLIFQAVEGAGELKMPPGKKLPAEAVAALREWIDAGAPWQPHRKPKPKPGNPIPTMSGRSSRCANRPARPASIPSSRKSSARPDCSPRRPPTSPRSSAAPRST